MDSNALNQRFKQAQGLSFAAIRLPGETDLHFCYATNAPQLDVLKYTSDAAPFFTFSPYGAGSLAYKLNPQLYMINEVVISGNKDLYHDGEVQPILLPENHVSSLSHYTTYVSQMVTAIQSKLLKKAVAARCEKVMLPNDYSNATMFGKLCESYPNACIYFFSIPGQTAWMGATPERLLVADKTSLTTVALAGTITATEEENWSDKEREEQSLTASFIRDLFKNMKLKGLSETPVKSILAGAVKHLSSGFKWKSDAETVKAKFHKILQQLNPTPAVCGLPQQAASSYISKHEGFERRYYSGFIGFQKLDQLSLFVNLRCMETAQDAAYLYAGAGITKESLPEKEWAETVKKMETLRSFL